MRDRHRWEAGKKIVILNGSMSSMSVMAGPMSDTGVNNLFLLSFDIRTHDPSYYSSSLIFLLCARTICNFSLCRSLRKLIIWAYIFIAGAFPNDESPFTTSTIIRVCLWGHYKNICFSLMTDCYVSVPSPSSASYNLHTYEHTLKFFKCMILFIILRSISLYYKSRTIHVCIYAYLGIKIGIF